MGCAFAVFAFLPWCQPGVAMSPSTSSWGVSGRRATGSSTPSSLLMTGAAVIVALQLSGAADKASYGETTWILQLPPMGLCRSLARSGDAHSGLGLHDLARPARPRSGRMSNPEIAGVSLAVLLAMIFYPHTDRPRDAGSAASSVHGSSPAARRRSWPS
ncbi:MAG: hypothetical protein R3D03_14465 [Geminicoccaceae bacterium]